MSLQPDAPAPVSGWVRLGKGKRLHWLNGAVTGCGRAVEANQAAATRVEAATYPFCRTCRRVFLAWQQARQATAC